MSYNAIIVRLQGVKKHPNADRLQVALCMGNQVVVGMEAREGDRGVFFPADGILSNDFCVKNELFPILDEKGKRIGGGFFDKNRRVRAQKFRGERSFGFWIPMTAFAYLPPNDATIAMGLAEGSEFDKIGDNLICEKHVTKATQDAIGKRKKKGARRETVMFKAHLETDQFWKLGRRAITPGCVVVLTEKLHGTSQRYGHVLEEVALPWWKRWLNKIAPFFPTHEWKHVVGTRNVILGDVENAAHESYRVEVMQFVLDALHKGETLFFEVVGYDRNGATIMPAPKIDDKDLASAYGCSHMTYKYGCIPGQAKMYVYRITMTNTDGVVTELPWTAVKARCRALLVEHVPEFRSFVYDPPSVAVDEVFAWEVLASEVSRLEVGHSTLDHGHIREGVCVRVEDGGALQVFKAKSHTFQVLEGIAKEAAEVVDVEEAA